MSDQHTANPQLHVSDSSLPGLASVFSAGNLRAIADGFRLDSTQAITAKLNYVRYKPHRRCLMLYRIKSSISEDLIVALALTKAGFDKKRQAMKRFGSDHQRWLAEPSDQVIYSLFPMDHRLPAVQKIYDLGSQTRVLRRMIGKRKGFFPQSLERLAYKPERRFVGLVHDNEGCERVIKLHSQERFKDTVERLLLLEQTDVDAPKMIHACSRYNAVCLPYLPGRSLSELITGRNCPRELITAVGMKLAKLHLQPITSAWCELPAIGQERLREIGESLTFLSPPVGSFATEIATEVTRRLANTESQLAVCHGDFYAKQVIVDEGAIHFIDFDQVGLADRYSDVANFVAQLYWRNLMGDTEASDVEVIGDAFLDGYRRACRQFNEERFRAQLAAALLRCAMHPFRNALPDWETGTNRLLQLAWTALHRSQIPHALST